MAGGRRAGAAPILLAILALAACEGPAGEAPGPPDGGEVSPSGESPPAEAPRAPDPADGQGRARVVPADPVVASSLGSWTVEWVAGPAGLPEGGAAVLQISPFWGWSPPQTRRPGSPGYTTARASDRSVHLALAEGAVPMTVIARVERGAMAPGDTLRFVYGDTAGTGRGSLARADRYAEAFEEFLIKTDGNADGFFVAVPDPPGVRILPGPAASLAVAAPALAAPEEPFAVVVNALDAVGNRTVLPPGSLRLLARSLATAPGERVRPPDTLQPEEDRLLGGGRVVTARLARPGLYRIEAELAGGNALLRGRNDLLLVEADSPFAGLLWGDLHCHSSLSDGTGDPADLYAYAREVSGLDVCAVSDHDAHGLAPLAEGGGWERQRRAAEGAYRPGEFVTLLAYEWTSWTWGHRNVYYPRGEGEVFPFTSPQSDTPAELWRRIAPFGGMTVPHHPGGGPIAIDWSVPSDEERERVVEICSIHGSSEAAGVERGIYRPVPGAMVRDALNAGHVLGILASGDTHDGHPGRRSVGAPVNGLVAFRAEERTREAVWAALRERRVYGTSGPRILLATDWGGVPPGSELEGAPPGPLVVRVAAPEPVEVVEVIGPEGTLATSYGGGRRTVKRFFADGAPPARWLYVRVVLADGELAWESPYWLGAARR